MYFEHGLLCIINIAEFQTREICFTLSRSRSFFVCESNLLHVQIFLLQVDWWATCVQLEDVTR